MRREPAADAVDVEAVPARQLGHLLARLVGLEAHGAHEVLVVRRPALASRAPFDPSDPFDPFAALARARPAHGLRLSGRGGVGAAPRLVRRHVYGAATERLQRGARGRGRPARLRLPLEEVVQQLAHVPQEVVPERLILEAARGPAAAAEAAAAAAEQRLAAAERVPVQETRYPDRGADLVRQGARRLNAVEQRRQHEQVVQRGPARQQGGMVLRRPPLGRRGRGIPRLLRIQEAVEVLLAALVRNGLNERLAAGVAVELAVDLLAGHTARAQVAVPPARIAGHGQRRRPSVAAGCCGGASTDETPGLRPGGLECECGRRKRLG